MYSYNAYYTSIAHCSNNTNNNDNDCRVRDLKNTLRVQVR